MFCDICKSPVTNGKCQLCGHKQEYKMQSVNLPKTKKVKKGVIRNNVTDVILSQEYNVIVEGLMYGHSGFSQATRNIACGLFDILGDKVSIIAHDPNEINDLDDKEMKEKLIKMATNKIENRFVFRIVMTHPLGIEPHPGCYNIAYAMFETKDMPKIFVEHLSNMDELWTPSKFNYDGFKKAGYKKPLKVKPLGVDTVMFDPKQVKALDIRGRKKFLFLSIMGFSERKGVEPLVVAFCEEFSDKEDVCLLIKGGWFDRDKAIDYINEIIAHKVKNKKIPLILYNSENMFQNDMPRLYKAANCFVLASRGEGWGLNYCEAMSMELPTIGTKATSQIDFMNDSNSYLIDINGWKLEPRCDWICHQYKGEKFADPNVNSLRKQMRLVYRNSRIRLMRGKQARKDMVEKYDWKISVKRMKQRLDKIMEGK